jgi:hypothetical protein
VQRSAQAEALVYNIADKNDDIHHCSEKVVGASQPKAGGAAGSSPPILTLWPIVPTMNMVPETSRVLTINAI